jgi:hypothetical protein
MLGLSGLGGTIVAVLLWYFFLRIASEMLLGLHHSFISHGFSTQRLGLRGYGAGNVMIIQLAVSPSLASYVGSTCLRVFCSY